MVRGFFVDFVFDLGFGGHSMDLLGGSSQDLFQWLGSPPIYNPFWPFGRGPTTRSSRDLRSPWLLTTWQVLG